MIQGPIVIVDDDPDDQQLLLNALAKVDNRINTRVFPSAIDTLEYLAEGGETPFIIFCDIRMPKMDGISLREKIEAHPVLKRKSIPFVYVTGSATSEDVVKAYDLSVQGFFTKPNLVEEWEELVRRILSYWNYCIHPNNLSKTDI